MTSIRSEGEDRDFVRGPHRSERYAENLEWFTEQRALAEAVSCPQCHVPAGETCRNDITGETLKRFPAHTPRIENARKAAAS